MLQKIYKKGINYLGIVIILVLLWGGLKGCSYSQESAEMLTIWAHSGQPSESQTLNQQVERFKAAYPDIPVKLTLLPEGSYNAQIQAEAIAGDLPDILEFDGPFVYNYIWQQNLIPLDQLLSPEVRQDLLPSIIKQGSYQGNLYSIGTFDSGLGLYARRSQLEKAGLRIPLTNETAWTAEEFQNALVQLAKLDEDKKVLDLKLNYQGEWFTYGFSPIIQSAGGDLIDRKDYQSADDVLNGPEAIAAMKQLQSWIQEGYVDPNIDDAAFTQGRVALSWVGHWVYADYAKAVGDDLVLLPLPNFGEGSKTGQGSWNWGITSNCSDPEAAIRFLAFLLQPEEVLAMTNANGAVPGTKSAIAQSPLYGENGALNLFAVQLLEGNTIPRPQTPAYPVITSAFRQAFDNIRHDLSVKKALNKAVTTIDQDIQDNEGYPFQ